MLDAVFLVCDLEVALGFFVGLRLDSGLCELDLREMGVVLLDYLIKLGSNELVR